jgi:hypothetical protein
VIASTPRLGRDAAVWPALLLHVTLVNAEPVVVVERFGLECLG